MAPHPWTWLDQVHGDQVVVVRAPGDGSGAEADAAVTSEPGAVLSVLTADCAPVVMWSTDPDHAAIGIAHAGWRGLYEGVLERTVDALTGLGASQIAWQLGPCVSASAYEFGRADLTTMALRFGPDVVAATPDGSPALDLAAAVRAAMRRTGVEEIERSDPPCTATSLDDSGAPKFFSWRARGDTGRQASVIWIDPAHG